MENDARAFGGIYRDRARADPDEKDENGRKA